VTTNDKAPPSSSSTPNTPSQPNGESGATIAQFPPATPDSRPQYVKKSDPLMELLRERMPHLPLTVTREVGDVVVRVPRASFLELVTFLKNDRPLDFSMIIDITAIDWLDSRDDRFEMVYHFMSMAHHYRLRVKVTIPESDAAIDSVVHLWAGANFMERETWDMYGIVFRGNNDLRRLLMYDEFKGHPLRKDYPVQGKQPRVPLIAPEVVNTAQRMNRPPLVTINKRKQPAAHEDVRGANRVLAEVQAAQQKGGI
jgi:NADH-quinone oxidoreductase subunit C